jgi:glycosyltransferase involved in cell wall biosynthesis
VRIGVHIPALPQPRSEATRLGREVVEALSRMPGVDCIVYGGAGTEHRFGRVGTPIIEAGSDDPLGRVVDLNPDRLDALIVLDPIGMVIEGRRPPARPIRELSLIGVVDDGTRAFGSEGSPADPNSATRGAQQLPRLRAYDVLLATTPEACETIGAWLNLPAGRFVLIQDPATAAKELISRISTRSESRVMMACGSTSRLAARPRLAIVSPWPPKRSGISTYATRLAKALRSHYGIDLYHQPGYVPEPVLSSGAFGCYEPSEFDRRDRVIGYRGVLYQMGNSFYHGFIYEMLEKCLGVVTLHDYCLSGFQFWRAHERPGDPFENLRRLMADLYPERIEEFAPQLRGWTEEDGGFAEALARRQLAVNRDVIAMASGVVVHSPWCLRQIRQDVPGKAGDVVVIPHGATVRRASREQRLATRRRFAIEDEALVVSCFGILAHGKMNVEAIEAFVPLARSRPDAVLLFVGPAWDGGAAQEAAEEAGLGERVRFLGRQPDASYRELLGAVDLGISLRRPPTYGETSGSLLDLLRHGVPTIINEAGTFADYPDEVVRKLDWEREGVAGLAEALRELADDRGERERLSGAAVRHVREQHGWPRVAECYADVIERYADTTGGLSAPARAC